MSSHPLLQTLHTIKADWQRDIAACGSLNDLETVRKAYWGKQGKGTALIAQLGSLAPQDKPLVAPAIQQFSRQAQEEWAHVHTRMQQEIEHRARQRQAAFDVTAPAPTAQGLPYGSLHPCTHIMRRIDDILQSMGFSPAQGPEVETAWFNFEALNIPQDHPARDMQDTLWLRQYDEMGQPLLLRTHTSSVQIRSLLTHKPPFALYTLGRVYRHEATDATHDYTFHQLEILLVDRDINVAHLATLLKECMQALFNKPDLTIRLRPSYFPFVEPGFEIDISCPFCSTGCGICKQSRWIELGGAGMVNPHTLRTCALDPYEWSGIACGLGIERLTMLIYGVSDIRLFHNTSVEVLRQWS